MIIQKELIECLRTNCERTAIEYGEKVISYSALSAASDKITRFLLAQSVGCEAVMGILLIDRSDIICAMIGAMNARCVFVPIDGSLPEGRLRTIREDLNLKYLITSRSTYQADGFTSVRKYFIEDILAGEIDGDGLQYPDFAENDSLYIYFTSGTTGTPKGIVGKNCSLLQFIKWEIETFQVNNATRFSQFISPYFDAFLRDIFVPLLAGGTICIPPPEDGFFLPEKITRWIDERDINLIHCVPSLFRIINNTGLTPEHYKSLQHVLLSGEKILPAQLKTWYATFQARIQLVNLYGPTETTMIRAYYKITAADIEQARILIGDPIAGTQLLIANDDFKPCGALVPGDLYIISNYTAKGYLNAPELTHEKFIKIHPGTPNETIAFKTGDKARRLINGKIDLLGREDRQVKLRGIRIELDEVECLLVQSDYIKYAVVLKYEENGQVDSLDERRNELLISSPSGGDESLIGFVIREDKEHPGEDFESAVQAYMADHLPRYMIPARIIEVNEFPLLANGKINYNGLLDCLTSVSETIVPPDNETEEKLLTIWKQILGDKQISTEDAFNTVGGNSLYLMRLIAMICDEYNVRLSLSQLFDNLTIKKQAVLLKKALLAPDPLIQPLDNQEQFTF